MFVVDLIRGLRNGVEMKGSIEECLLQLKKEVDDFNKDLQQISQTLTHFFVSDLYDLCLNLLWKWH
jgi:hypothetical protein